MRQSTEEQGGGRLRQVVHIQTRTARLLSPFLSAVLLASSALASEDQNELASRLSSMLSSGPTETPFANQNLVAHTAGCELSLAYDFTDNFCVPGKLKYRRQGIDLHLVEGVSQSEFRGMYAVTFQFKPTSASVTENAGAAVREEIGYCDGSARDGVADGSPMVFIPLAGRERFSDLFQRYIEAYCGDIMGD